MAAGAAALRRARAGPRSPCSEGTRARRPPASCASSPRARAARWRARNRRPRREWRGLVQPKRMRSSRPQERAPPGRAPRREPAAALLGCGARDVDPRGQILQRRGRIALALLLLHRRLAALLRAARTVGDVIDLERRDL